MNGIHRIERRGEWAPDFSGHFLPSREGLNTRFVILSVGHALLLP